jgi:hypothetical protein
MPMITGSCLCGAVRYQVDGPLARMTHCHCSMCRKVHGAAFATYATGGTSRFAWIAGEDAITHFASSRGVDRAFCRHCGSVVPSRFADTLALPAGNLDGDPGVRPSAHIFTAQAAPWHHIADDLPQHEDWDYQSERSAVARPPLDAPSPGVLRGSCLCSAVAFEVTGPIVRAHNCFCSRCRKGRSAAHASNAFTAMDDVRFTRGEDRVTLFRLPEARFFSTVFCSSCGSGVPRKDPGRNIAVIPLGALDDDPRRGVDSNIFVTSAAPWYPAPRDRPCFDGPAA